MLSELLVCVIVSILLSLSLISLEDSLKDHPFYIEATKLAVKVRTLLMFLTLSIFLIICVQIYLQLHDHPATKEVEMNKQQEGELLFE